ncbi:hypothetical protein KDL29_16450, partial [bacterium]|nr:hypothetical protein [bacterium]
MIFRCWDTQQLQEPQYWLQGQFFYKSDAGHYSENDDISVLDFSGDVADNYILGCFGSFRSKGKDILGEEHSAPWWVETGRSAQVWGFHGIPVPGNPLRQGSPFGSSNGTPPSPFQYGNPNGVR